MNETIAAPDIDFEKYREILELTFDESPQRQGLSKEEFSLACSSSQTVFGRYIGENGPIMLPQIIPIQSFHWLNERYFLDHFSQELSENRIFYMANYSGLDFKDDVESSLQELAEKSGYVVVDFPSTNPDYINVILDNLRAIGIDVEENSLIGEQTYFSGESKFKIQRNRGASTNFIDTYSYFREEPEFLDNPEFLNLELNTLIEEADAARIYEFYAEAYEKVSDHPCQQSLDPDEFMEMMKSEDVIKILVRNNNKVETIALFTDNIAQLDWVNLEFYKDKYEKELSEGRLIWFPGIATNPDPEVMGHNIPLIVKLLAKVSDRGNFPVVLVYDSPDANTGFLDKYLESEINSTDELEMPFKILGKQTYKLLKLSKIR